MSLYVTEFDLLAVKRAIWKIVDATACPDAFEAALAGGIHNGNKRSHYELQAMTHTIKQLKKIGMKNKAVAEVLRVSSEYVSRHAMGVDGRAKHFISPEARRLYDEAVASGWFEKADGWLRVEHAYRRETLFEALLQEGMTRAGIADLCGVSYSTVQNALQCYQAA